MKPGVGIIGLGIMGKRMAENLLKAGFSLSVWNRTRAKAEELRQAGARLANTPREAAASSDFLLTVVSDPPALEQVLWGADGAFEGLRRDSVYIDSSTVGPVLARRIADACAQRGVEFLDAPVTGGSWAAEKGDLVFMVGGKRETVERAEPVLGAMGKRWFHLGPNGAGQTVKLAMNMILALEVGALAEALALVTAAGLPPGFLVEVLQSSTARSAVLDIKAPMMLSGNYAPSFPLRLMHKDIRLALELASQLALPLPATASACEIYGSVKDMATEDLDYAAIARFWEHR